MCGGLARNGAADRAVFRWSWLQGRDGRRRGSRVGSYWLLIGRPATNSLNYRLYFLASPPPSRRPVSTYPRVFSRRLPSLPLAFFRPRGPFLENELSLLRVSLFPLSFPSPLHLSSARFAFSLSLSFSLCLAFHHRRFTLFSRPPVKGERPESSEKSSADLITWNNRKEHGTWTRVAASIPTLRDF